MLTADSPKWYGEYSTSFPHCQGGGGKIGENGEKKANKKNPP